MTITAGSRGNSWGGVNSCEPGQFPIVRSDDEWLGERRRALHARGQQHVMQREHRPERVAVRADVAREPDRGRREDAARPHAPVRHRRFRIRCSRVGSFLVRTARVPTVLLCTLAMVDIAQDVFDALTRDDALIDVEVEPRHLADAHLPADHASQM